MTQSVLYRNDGPIYIAPAYIARHRRDSKPAEGMSMTEPSIEARRLARCYNFVNGWPLTRAVSTLYSYPA